MNPSIGEIVHYYRDNKWDCVEETNIMEPNAAIVIGINPDDSLNLAVWDSYGRHNIQTKVKTARGYGTVPTPGCWNWKPEK